MKKHELELIKSALKRYKQLKIKHKNKYYSKNELDYADKAQDIADDCENLIETLEKEFNS